ncbi:hypothetical protein [Streptomyces sp. HNM0574]|uniref:hypothetical protein n=1 Tax=Streptomyces sp. HNM0574 TaxID=2714954 RepID=UPI00146A9E12|nr:hypothetical protein [Streptomyces sp. HNM0574]NLU65722.1 hypothetical protein [Streptomyces sp. HNM0574]
MPLTPEEPQIYESVPGPRSAAGSTRTPQASRPAPPIPGPRSSSRPAPPRADSKGPTPGRPANQRNGGVPQQSKAAQPTAPTAEIELVPAADGTAVESADDSVDKLLDAGRAPGEVLVLTTGEQHPWAQHELSFGEDAYWAQLTDGEDVFCAAASDVTRMPRRPVVVLAVNGGTDAEVAEALPAAMAKAGTKLIVCGDPKRLSALL